MGIVNGGPSMKSNCAGLLGRKRGQRVVRGPRLGAAFALSAPACGGAANKDPAGASESGGDGGSLSSAGGLAGSAGTALAGGAASVPNNGGGGGAKNSGGASAATSQGGVFMAGAAGEGVTAGGNNNNSWGTFYEGAIVAGFPADDTELAVVQNIKALGYGEPASAVCPD
jgi:hypothetical protein